MEDTMHKVEWISRFDRKGIFGLRFEEWYLRNS